MSIFVRTKIYLLPLVHHLWLFVLVLQLYFIPWMFTVAKSTIYGFEMRFYIWGCLMGAAAWFMVVGWIFLLLVGVLWLWVRNRQNPFGRAPPWVPHKGAEHFLLLRLQNKKWLRLLYINQKMFPPPKVYSLCPKIEDVIGFIFCPKIFNTLTSQCIFLFSQ